MKNPGASLVQTQLGSRISSRSLTGAGCLVDAPPVGCVWPSELQETPGDQTPPRLAGLDYVSGQPLGLVLHSPRNSCLNSGDFFQISSATPLPPDSDLQYAHCKVSGRTCSLLNSGGTNSHTSCPDRMQCLSLALAVDWQKPQSRMVS